MYFIEMLAGDLILINMKRKRICNKPNWSRKPVGASSMLNLGLHICCQFFFATSVLLFLFFNNSNRPSTLGSIGILQEKKNRDSSEIHILKNSALDEH